MVSVHVQDSVQQQGNTTAPQASTWNFAGVSAGTESNASTGIGTADNLSFKSSAALPVGNIISNRGDVSLTSAGTAIANARTGGGSNVSANNITLTAGTTIGSGTALNINSAYSSTGVVTATASGAIAIDEIAGNLSLNQVRTTGGIITLTSAGAILDGRSSGGPTDNVESSQAPTLSAGSGIGTLADFLVTNVVKMQANAGTGGLFIHNISSGGLVLGGGPTVSLTGASVNLLSDSALTVSNAVLASGAVALSAPTITASSGATVQSTTSSVTLTATGHRDAPDGQPPIREPRERAGWHQQHRLRRLHHCHRRRHFRPLGRDHGRRRQRHHQPLPVARRRAAERGRRRRHERHALHLRYHRQRHLHDHQHHGHTWRASTQSPTATSTPSR